MRFNVKFYANATMIGWSEVEADSLDEAKKKVDDVDLSTIDWELVGNEPVPGSEEPGQIWDENEEECLVEL